jgi:hypothetical protein
VRYPCRLGRRAQAGCRNDVRQWQENRDLVRDFLLFCELGEIGTRSGLEVHFLPPATLSILYPVELSAYDRTSLRTG